MLACGERNGRGVGKCVRMWGPNTLPHTLSHISSLTSSFPTSPLPPPHSNCRTHAPTPPLIPVPLPTSSFLPPHPNTFSYYPHISPHLFKVWQSYHVTKFLWRSYCGEVTMWRSYWQPCLVSAPTFFLSDKLTPT